MKPIHRGGRAADAVAEKALEENTEQNRAPADKDGGGIEICDWRSSLQVHPRNQPAGMDDEGYDEQRNA
jgi:hypothetical protein